MWHADRVDKHYQWLQLMVHVFKRVRQGEMICVSNSSNMVHLIHWSNVVFVVYRTKLFQTV